MLVADECWEQNSFCILSGAWRAVGSDGKAYPYPWL